MPSRWIACLLILAACGEPAGGDPVDASSGFPDVTLPDVVDGAPPVGDIDAAPPVGDVDGAPPAEQVDAGPPPGDDVAGCTPESRFLPVPADPAAPGPWPVGARTVQVGRLKVELFYPAVPGSEAGKDTARYDLRKWLPTSEQGKIPDADNPWQDCDCVRDLPVDTTHGPYPVVVFIHGTAGFRTQSLVAATHWASRGFVVIAADHPGLFLGDMLAIACFQAQSGQRTIAADVDAMLAALPSFGLPVDLERVAVAGHSAGASEAAGLTNRPGVRLVIPMAGGATVKTSPSLELSLHMAATSDGVVEYPTSKNGYNSSPSPKRFVGVENSGHLCFSDLCELKNTAGQNLLQIAQAKNVCGVFLAGNLFDCDPGYIPAAAGMGIVRYASTAALEGVLRCQAGSEDKIDVIENAFPEVSETLSSP